MKIRQAKKVIKRARSYQCQWVDAPYRLGTLQRAVSRCNKLAMAMPCEDDEDFDDYDSFGDDREDDCHYCGGEGWGMVGCDWDSDDPINGPYDGEIEKCPCCGGTGNAKDCRFW